MADFNIPLDEYQREVELSRLLDPEEYRKRRTSSEKRAASFTTDEWKMLRRLAKTNTFFLAYTVLNYSKLSENLHGDVCGWIKDTRMKRFRLLLLPRGHYKSTIYTITHSIQSSLPDDSNSNEWPYCLGTDIRICLMHEVAGVAQKFLSEIQNHFLSNEFLMALFPECIPDPKKHTVNMSQLELPRTSFWKEKTFEAMGVGGRSQGNHYNILKPDDLMGKEAKDSKIILQSTKEWIDNLQSFLTTFANPDHIDFTGTRWGHDDIYSHIMEVYGVAGQVEDGQLYVYKRGIEEIIHTKEFDSNGKPIVKSTPIFPEEYPSERLVILKKNKEIYSAQYMNDPESAEGELDRDKLRYFYWRNKESFTAFDDRTEGKVIIYHRELNKILLVDPALTGKLGMVVTGTDRRNRHFVLDTVKRSLRTPDFIRDVFNLVLRWQIRDVVVEKVLFSALYEPIFDYEMARRGVRFRVILQSVPSKKDKEKRIIDSLSPYLEEGTIFVNEGHKELLEEFKRLGFTSDVHLLDALSLGPHHWKPYSGNSAFGNTQGNYSQMPERDELTGYTAIQ